MPPGHEVKRKISDALLELVNTSNPPFFTSIGRPYVNFPCKRLVCISIIGQSLAFLSQSQLSRSLISFYNYGFQYCSQHDTSSYSVGAPTSDGQPTETFRRQKTDFLP